MNIFKETVKCIRNERPIGVKGVRTSWTFWLNVWEKKIVTLNQHSHQLKLKSFKFTVGRISRESQCTCNLNSWRTKRGRPTNTIISRRVPLIGCACFLFFLGRISVFKPVDTYQLYCIHGGGGGLWDALKGLYIRLRRQPLLTRFFVYCLRCIIHNFEYANQWAGEEFDHGRQYARSFFKYYHYTECCRR